MKTTRTNRLIQASRTGAPRKPRARIDFGMNDGACGTRISSRRVVLGIRWMPCLLLVVFLGLSGFLVKAQDIAAVASSAKTDLAAALDELSQVRNRVEEERIPLARQLSQLEQEVIDERRGLERAQRAQENQLV